MTDINIDNITEDEAMTLFSQLRTKFGWQGTIFTKFDVEEAYNDRLDRLGIYPTAGAFDAVWASVSTDPYWVDVLSDRTTECGWDYVQMAVREAMNNDEV